MTGSSSYSSAPSFLIAIFVFIFAITFRTGLIHAPGEFDEFYHLLAARGWVESGSPRILDGEYWRGVLFTRLVAGLFVVTGTENLATARLISVVSGSLIPVVLFLWINRAVGIGTGLVAAALAVLWPQGILEAQFVRFYALQVLCFLSGTAAVHLLLTDRASPKFLFGFLAIMCWSIAIHLQISTAIGLAAVFLAAATLLLARYPISRLGWIAITSAVFLWIILMLAVPGLNNLAEKTWSFYRWAPGHAENLRDYHGFYVRQLINSHGVLWFGSLILVPLSFRKNAELATFCSIIFVVCMLAHSFGAMKALRYLSYSIPCLFTLWALGLSAGYDLLGRYLQSSMRLAITFSVGVALVATASFAPRSVKLAVGNSLAARGDWSSGAEVVGDWIDASFVATTRELHQVTYIGPYDVLFSPSRLTELRPPKELGIDPRTGRPVVGNPDTMAQILSCIGDGLLVTSPHWWRNAGWEERLNSRIDPAVSLKFRERGAVLAVRWKSEPRSRTDCTALADYFALAERL